MAGSKGLGAEAVKLVQESAPKLDDLFRPSPKISGLQNSSEEISESPTIPVDPKPIPLKRGRGRPSKNTNESTKETKSYFIDSELAEKVRTYSFLNRETNSSVIEAALTLFFSLDEANLLKDIDAYSLTTGTGLTREEVIKQSLALFLSRK